MFSTNIILLLCVAGFIEKSSTAGNGETALADGVVTSDPNNVENINPKLYELKDEQWEDILKQYDDDHNKSYISGKELQKLVYDKFKGFLTISQADSFIFLINSEQQIDMGLDELKKMKPIIFVLSQRVKHLEDENVNNSKYFSRKTFEEIIAENYKKLSLEENVVSEVLTLVGQDDLLPIKRTKYYEILKMLGASERMAIIHNDFKSQKDGGVADFLEFISKHKLFKDPLGNLQTEKSHTTRDKLKKIFFCGDNANCL